MGRASRTKQQRREQRREQVDAIQELAKPQAVTVRSGTGTLHRGVQVYGGEAWAACHTAPDVEVVDDAEPTCRRCLAMSPQQMRTEALMASFRSTFNVTAHMRDLRLLQRRPNLPAQHIGTVWTQALPQFVVMHAQEPVVEGPHGECWKNAWEVARSDPERYVYCEGLAYIEGHGRIVHTVTEDTDHYLRRGVDYPHAWVWDNETGRIAECTAGWAETQPFYRGVRIRAEHVDPVFQQLQLLGEPFASFLEIDYVTS